MNKLNRRGARIYESSALEQPYILKTYEDTLLWHMRHSGKYSTYSIASDKQASITEIMGIHWFYE